MTLVKVMATEVSPAALHLMDFFLLPFSLADGGTELIFLIFGFCF